MNNNFITKYNFKFFARITFILMFVFTGVNSFSQKYPINAGIELLPPYSTRLSDYVTDDIQRIAINLYNRDVTLGNYDVKLSFKIEGQGISITTSPYFMPPPINIAGGEYVKLFGFDLDQYFNPDNLLFSGLSKSEYKKLGRLPDGIYKFSVTVHDYNRNSQVSNVASSIAWIILNEPPLLQFPKDKSQEGGFDIKPIVFKWLPRHTGSPNSAFSTEFQFELYEIRIPGINPYDIVRSQTPVFTSTTMANTLVYLPAELSLEPGIQYAWRVKAYDTQGRDLFKEQGYSQVYSFTFSKVCDAPFNLKAEVTGTNSAEFSWMGNINHTSYTLELKDESGFGESSTYTTSLEKKEFDNTLKSDNKYSARVMAECFDSQSKYTDWVSIETKAPQPDEICECKFTGELPKAVNQTPNENLMPGDIIKYLGSELKIKEIEKIGAGKYKGKADLNVKIWGIKMQMGFEEAFVNTDNEVVVGEFVSLYDKNSPFFVDVGKVKEAVELTKDIVNDAQELTDDVVTKIGNLDTPEDTVTIQTPVKEVYVNEQNQIVAVDNSGNETIVREADERTLITDSKGKEYVVGRTGDVMSVAEFKKTNGGSRTGITREITRKESEDLDNNASVTFAEAQTQMFGFDSWDSKYPQIKNNYKTLNFNNEYTVPWKSVQSFSTDKVNFTTSAEDVYFKTETGVPIPAIGTTIQVRGSSAENETAVYAYRMESDSSEKIVGKLNVISYDLQPKTLIPVSVNGATVSTDLQFALNNIYKQAVTNWQVLPKQSITIEFEDGNFNHGGSGFAKTYNKDQSHVIETFLEGKSKDDKACYLFFINGVKFDEKQIAGYMPLQRQFGFIYNNPPSNIIAHELGHGAFNLRHTFSDKYNIPEGTTDNLMDYSNTENATRLWKEQWDQVQDPDFVFLAGLQKEKEGEYKTDDGTLHLKILQEIRCAYLNNSEKIDISSYTERYSSVKGKDIYMLTNHFRTTSILQKLGLKELYFEKNTSNRVTDITKLTSINEGTTFREFRGAYANKYHKFSHHIDIGNLKIYSNDINSLIKYLTPTDSDLKNSIDKIFKSINIDAPDKSDIKALKNIASCASKHISPENKYKLIKSILKIDSEEFYEDLTLDLIRTTSTGKDSKKLYSKLMNDPDLLAEMAKGLDNITNVFCIDVGNENNLDRFYQELFELFKRSYNETEFNSIAQNTHDNNRYYFYDINKNNSSLICHRNVTSASQNNATINITESLYETIVVNTAGVGSVNPCVFKNKFSYPHKLDDILVITNCGNDLSVKQGVYVMPAFAYYLLIKAADDKLIEQNLNSLFFLVTTITPFDEFYLLGKAMNLASKGAKTINFAKAKKLLSDAKCAVSKKYVTSFNGKSEIIEKYVKFGDEVVDATKVLKLADKLRDYKNISNKLDLLEPSLKQKFLDIFAESGEEVWKKFDANEGGLIDAWEIVSNSKASLQKIKHIEAIYAFKKANPDITYKSIRNAFDELKASRRQPFVMALESCADNKVLIESLNKYKLASVDEIKDALNKMRNHKTGKPQSGNLGYLETDLPVNIKKDMWESVSMDRAELETHIFDAIEASGSKGTWLRITDSEYRMLNDLAKELKGVKGESYPQIVGRLKIVSENPYCKSCQGVIQQFSDMFPNIEITLIDGVR